MEYLIIITAAQLIDPVLWLGGYLAVFKFRKSPFIIKLVLAFIGAAIMKALGANIFGQSLNTGEVLAVTIVALILAWRVKVKTKGYEEKIVAQEDGK